MRLPSTHGKDKQTRPDLRRPHLRLVPKAPPPALSQACSPVCYGRLAVPEQLGEETLEEDEVDDEDLATGEGPGVPGEERRRTTL